ncbi:hypothetical protein HanIR_Chr05g0246971 [Helianthus annuus]|nr:hypothetical protein HanIR_Chr05g0246971 [Helianthus annuus]
MCQEGEESAEHLFCGYFVASIVCNHISGLCKLRLVEKGGALGDYYGGVLMHLEGEKQE